MLIAEYVGPVFIEKLVGDVRAVDVDLCKAYGDVNGPFMFQSPRNRPYHTVTLA
jgi:hypothetical protein